MSTFKAALSVCGLSQADAAEFLQVALPTIKSWCSDSNPKAPPLGVWKQLASLFEQIQDAADGAADIMDLEGIDPRSFNNLEADLVGDPLPIAGAMEAAGAMALLMAVADFG